MRRILLVLAICVLALLQLGLSCGRSGPKQEGAPSIRVVFDFPFYEGIQVNDSLPVHIYAIVSNVQLQAVELSVAGTPGLLRLHSAGPSPEFDDDGALFITPTYSPGEDAIEDIVDLRHGASPILGGVQIATFWIDALAAGDASLDFTEAKFATASGEEFSVKAFRQAFPIDD